MLVMGPVGIAEAAEVRLAHAVPGQGPAALEVDGEATPQVGFGQVSDYAEFPNGEVTLTLGELDAEENLSEGRYTAVAWRRGDQVMLDVFPDGDAQPGRARVRAIHAAGELGEGDVMLDGQTLADSLGPGEAGEYQAVDPGDYQLSVTRPGGGGSPLAEDSVNLTAGTASTAIVVGSGGRPVQVVLASDSVAAPSEGPATGLGGLEDGTPWAAVLLAALFAGALGGGAFRFARRRGA
jgi:Domain of unknown function (DUF4397)